MRGWLLSSGSLLGLLLVAACQGGGSPADPSGSADPPDGPDPVPPQSDPALTRPISASLLCGNGLAKRWAAVSAEGFVAAAAGLGIEHRHEVDPAIWTREPGGIESVMRTGAVLAGEITDDCWPDLIFSTGATVGDQVVTYENRHGTGFSQRTLSFAAMPAPVAGLAMADVDADYRLDLVVGNLLAGETRVYAGGEDGGFKLLQDIAMPGSTFGLAFRDFAGDAWLDAYAAHWDVNPPAYPGPGALRNGGVNESQPTGRLIEADLETGLVPPIVSQGFNLVPAFVDLNKDGFPDLLIAADLGASEVLVNSGSQYFLKMTDSVGLSDENAAGAAIRDFDNDGNWDWFVSSVYGPQDGRPWPWGRAGNALYWGREGAPYLAPSDTPTGAEDAAWPWGVCAQDFDNDGLVDLFVENGFGFAPESVMAAAGYDPFVQQIDESLYDMKFSRARLFLNAGDRTFLDAAAAWGIEAPTNGRGVACLDYDRDGDIDIAIAQNSGPALLYENLHSARGGDHFLALRLLSVPPNTYAVGALVEIEAGGRAQMRELSANSNFGGQDAYELHFGLGPAETVDSIKVRWPGGSMQDLSDVAADRFLTLLDPGMLAYLDADRDRRVRDAIAGASAYVAGHPELLTNDAMAFLSMMQRNHGLALPYSPAGEIDARILELESEGRSADALRAYRRLFDPDYQLDSDVFASLSGLDAITFASVYCHQFALTDAGVLELESLLDHGGYDTTHALLGLILAVDNACVMPPAFDPRLIGDAVRAVYAVAQGADGDALTDLRIEAMTFLAAAGRLDLIRPDWVDAVLYAQEPSGAWKTRPGAAEPSGHTTGLALWLLLQLADAGKIESGIIAQPWDA